MTRLLMAILFVFAATAIAVFFLLENPDRFKPQLTSIAADATGYQIDIDGELSWRYWPPLAIKAEALSVSTNGEAFARFNSLEADIDLIPLLTGQRALNIETIAIDGGEVQIQRNSDGSYNWEAKPTGPPTGPPTGSPVGKPADIPSNTDAAPASDYIPSLKAFALSNVRIDYRDASSGEDIRILLASIQTGSIKAETPFNAAMTFTLKDMRSGNSVSADTTGRFQINEGGAEFGFEEMTTTMTAATPDTRFPAVTILSEGHWRGENQNIVINRLNLQATGVQASFTGIVSLGSESPRTSGEIAIESADFKAFAERLELEVPVNFLRITSDITANNKEIKLRSFEGGFDESTVKGALSISLADKPAIKSELRIDRLDLNQYLTQTNDGVQSARSPAPSTAAIATTTTQPASTDAIIPTELLSGISLSLITRIDTLIFDKHELSQSKIELSSINDQLTLLMNSNTLGGKFVLGTESSLDSPVNTTAQLSMEGLNVTKLTEWESFSGTLSGNGNWQFSGAGQNQMTSSIQGKLLFSVSDGQLDVRAIKNLAQQIDAVRGKRSSVSDWPDLMPFDEMNGQHVFTSGLATGQIFSAKAENLSLNALGGFDLQTQQLAYDVTAMFSQTDTGPFKVSDQLSGIRWPMVCEGSIDRSPQDLCFGRDGAIADLVADILKQDLKRRGESKVDEWIEEKIPEDFRDLTRDLLKDIFKSP